MADFQQGRGHSVKSELFFKKMTINESFVDLAAGGFAGICQVLVGHPFDTIKVDAKV